MQTCVCRQVGKTVSQFNFLLMLSEHPGQRSLEERVKAVPDPRYDQKLEVVRTKAISVVAEALALHKVDVIVSLADARIASLAATAGIAVGTVPVGFADFNGRAWGLCVIAGERGEGKILEVMSAWEKLFPEAQVPPPMLVNWGQESHL